MRINPSIRRLVVIATFVYNNLLFLNRIDFQQTSKYIENYFGINPSIRRLVFIATIVYNNLLFLDRIDFQRLLFLQKNIAESILERHLVFIATIAYTNLIFLDRIDSRQTINLSWESILVRCLLSSLYCYCFLY